MHVRKRRFRSAVIILVIALAMSALLPTTAFGLTTMQLLGKKLFYDTNLSQPAGQACAACHGPQVGFTGPDSTINAAGAVYEGAVANRFGNRKPPSAAYAGNSPILHLTTEFAGGMFWDGRATGWTLDDPLAEQAQGPFLNPLEQNNLDATMVVTKVRNSKYAPLFKQVWGKTAFANTTKAYEYIGRSIAAFERSSEVSKYKSRYDTYLRTGQGLKAQEKRGLALFFGTKAKCGNCHKGKDLTDYTYVNLGVPKNADNPFYKELDWNPLGSAWIDNGLGAFLQSTTQYASYADANMGKHKVPTVRNVDKRPYAGFVKAYGHNGYFKSLEDVVHFYNTRDVVSAGWPAPEVSQNLNTTSVGNLGLTAQEEADIVAFLKTLTDR